MMRALLLLLGVGSLLGAAMEAHPRTEPAGSASCALCLHAEREPAPSPAAESGVVSPGHASAVSDAGIEFIKRCEGFAAKPHWDHARWSVGYGSRSDDARGGITEAAANDALRREATRLGRRIAAASRVPLSQHHVDALTSFAYNVGESALLGYRDRPPSTLWTLVQAGDFEGAANEFERWTRAGGRVLRGLVNRRRAEAALFRGEGR